MLGKTLAHYKITAHLGTGGMGEVYRAQDTKLRRDVALKLLPPEFAADPARMARFEQEARALAALNHTNVSGIYGIEQDEDRRFLVMELAEGEDLSALVDEPGDSGAGLADSPTILNTMTQPGIILGTAAYMSPEQARGRPVDWRTDIWAFGCVLCEMLSGRQTYGRPTVTDTLAAIIERDPDFDLLPGNVTPALKALLRRTLVKDRRERLQAIGDARIALQEIRDGGTDEADPVSISARPTRWVAAILAAVLLTAAGTWWLKGTPPGISRGADDGTLRLTLALPAQYPLHFVGGSPLGTEFTAFDLSSDGSKLVYHTRSEGFRGLVAHDLAGGEFRPLVGTDNAFLPTFSPDGAWVAFLADGQLKRVPYAGGGVEVLATAVDTPDLLWSRDGHLYWLDRQGAILNRMRPALGAPVETVLDPCNSRMVEDWSVPREVLLKTDGSFERLLPDGSRQPLGVRGGHAHLFGNRYLLTTQSGRLVGYRIDGAERGPLTAPHTVLTGLRTTPHTGRAHYAVADNGLLAYVSGPPADVARLVRRYPDGREEQLPLEPRVYSALDVLPDGSRLAIEVFDSATDSHVEVLDLKTGNRQVVGDDTRRSQPIWSADGASLCLVTQVDSTYNIVEYPIDSVEAPTVLLSSRQRLSPWDWSGDGNLLVLTERGSDGVGNGALTVWDRRTGTFSPQAQPTASYLWSAAMSPDDRSIAYTQVGDAGSEVYVVPYPATGKRWLVSAGTGEEPLWLEHGKALVFRRGQGWYKVTYDDAGGFRASAPELMFEGPYINIGGMEYRVLADGSLILMVSANTRDSADHLDMVVGWDRELAGMLGAGED